MAVPKVVNTALEEDVVRYVAGYVAKKLRRTHRELGSPTEEAPSDTWVENLSRGGLLNPSIEWYSACLRLEEHFQHHTIQQTKALGELINSVPSTISCPKTALILYLRVRLYERVRQLNKCLKHEATSRSRKKKMAKFTQ